MYVVGAASHEAKSEHQDSNLRLGLTAHAPARSGRRSGSAVSSLTHDCPGLIQHGVEPRTSVSLHCDIISAAVAPAIPWLISALINRQAVTPGSRSYLMGGGISSSEVFPSELSVHTIIAEADMTGHFENFIIFFQDIGHGAFCSCLLYISVLETGCSYLLLPPPMSCHPGNKNETSFSDRFVEFLG